MKLKNIIYILTLFGLITTGSCKKFLDQVPEDRLTIDEIFKRKNLVEKYLAQVYANMPNELQQRFVGSGYSGPWRAGSDEAKYNWDFHYANQLNYSTWKKTDNNVATFWLNYYKSIRNATDFINNIDGADANEVSAVLKKRFKAEARGVRALYYFFLVRMYGPVPLLGDQVIQPDAPLNEVLRERNSMDECIDYIVNQLDSAAMDLPYWPGFDEQPNSAPEKNAVQWGRISKGVCKAYKEKALLLAASPLFNGNADYASLKNNDGKQLISQTYDQNKWKKAADAAKAFIDEFVPAYYDLYTVNNSDPFIAAYLAGRNVVTDEWNKEWIFGRPNSNLNIDYDIRPKLVGFPGNLQGAGALGVTQSMVDAYFMKNGLPITDPASGYLSTGFSDFKAPFDVKARRTYNQWVNREPRFYVGVTYNNSYWLNQSGSDKEVVVNMEFNGNSGRSQSTSDVSPTGYIVRKGYITGGNKGGLYLRLAEIYLDYAEALNEYNPGHADILIYLNKIRKRAFVPEYGSAELPAPASQEEMRQAIRRERRVELAFESVRYFDCHRWKVAEVTDNGTFYGMNMNENGDKFYKIVPLEVRVFRKRDYLWPIPDNDVLKTNKLLVQNTGW